MNVLIFGAGSTGRGHLAAVLYENGLRGITFVEKDPGLVAFLNARRSFKVHLLGEQERTLEITDFSVLDQADRRSVNRALFKADLVLTAVCPENLGDVAPLIASGIKERKRLANRTFLNVLACENLDRASSLLKKHVFSLLSAEEVVFGEECVGFPDVMISRVVPLAGKHPERLVAEDYNEWVVEKENFKGPDPGFPGMELVENFQARLERKLWIHNGGHATVAYAAWRKNYPYVHQALADPYIASFAGQVLDELGEIVARKHGFPLEEIRSYEQALVRRGSQEALRDEVSRVVRNPLRKLGIKDRLLGPAVYAAKHGLRHSGILASIVNVTFYYQPDDSQSGRMQEIISRHGFRFFLSETLRLKGYPELVRELTEVRAREERGTS